ncbi:uncharacterized protein LAESUDRAFT_727450 [Laetiporus sulphureus 93-53]|uniref:DNA endonuclease activator Ctp1 C-terminal domain-containing protein n=1 Tax=Laetiporus sulphureus 93-53 TaxID=1314785 RepID=A0A165DHA8_9APHY|nr:uncharacterized protein LAESUDRAFT_727450 [Laetiporus sulphureus 93-53]KZT04876.1 hypothetical protein LAESUDRAFT_727450 [Laetiporus sulphureus 93-53]
MELVAHNILSGPMPSNSRDNEGELTSAQPIKLMEGVVRRVRRANDDLRTELFAVSQRGDHLARGFGFKTIDEAEATIAARPAIFNRAFVEQAESKLLDLETQVKKHVNLEIESCNALQEASRRIDELKKENARLSAELKATKRKDNGVRPLQDVTPVNAHGSHDTSVYAPLPSLSSLTAVSSSTGDLASIKAELQELRKSYDALRQAKERSDAKHMADYVKWRNFKQWMFDEKEASLSSILVEGKTPNWKRILKLRKKYMKIGPQTDTPESSKAPEATTSAHISSLSANISSSATHKPSPSTHAPSPTTRIPSLRTQAGVKDLAESEPPIGSLTSHLMKAQDEEKQAESPAAFPPKAPKALICMPPKSQKRKLDEMSSSETEDDSQAPSPIYETQPGLVRRFLESPVRTSSRRKSEPTKPTATVCKSPRKPHSPSVTSPRSRDLALAVSPRKRVNSTPARESSADKENAHTPNTACKRPVDYSVYKGRGRYASNASATKTINADFKMDTARNAGVEFQFDEVVRNKESRKHLHADDCECCRGYYEGLNPMPPRLQRPLWRSPSPSKRKHEHGPSTSSARTVLAPDSDDERQQAIEEHKREISRHRQRWERPLTPPGYWEIGFPDTQEAAEINARAREMHEQKRARIEAEASRGGRYKRR